MSVEFILLLLSLSGVSLCFSFVYRFVMNTSEPGTHASPSASAASGGLNGKPTTRSGVVFFGWSARKLVRYCLPARLQSGSVLHPLLGPVVPGKGVVGLPITSPHHTQGMGGVGRPLMFVCGERVSSLLRRQTLGPHSLAQLQTVTCAI